MSTLTPFARKMSTEILGAHFTGAYAAINRLEHVLELGTASVTGHAMLVVDDQASPALHRRIYEGTIRGWLESPAPVIRRGGVVVPPGEYTLFAALGAISFHAQQAPGSVITADFTHITNVSALRGHPILTTGVHGVGASAVESVAGAQGKVDTLRATVPLLAGRAGGQTIRGGVAASENLTLDSTAHATKGNIVLNPTGGNVSVGTEMPTHQLHLSTDSAGKPGTNTWTIVSDERLKENITLADLKMCYETVKDLPLKRFTWKNEAYTAEEVGDRSKLGWISQDVAKHFKKSTKLTKFTCSQEVVTGEEEYEEQDFVMEETEVEIEEINVIDGKAVLVNGIKKETVKRELYDEIPVVDEAGNAVLDNTGSPRHHRVPRMTKKTRPKKESALEIEDCLTLNSDQIIAALYGAVQYIIQKMELKEE